MLNGKGIKRTVDYTVCRGPRINSPYVKIAFGVFLVAFCLTVKCNFTLVNMQLWDQYYTPKHRQTNTTPNPTPPPPRPDDYCSQPPLSPQDADEEQRLLNLISWPEAPPMLPSFSLENTSAPAHSRFTILPGPEGREWRVGDQLEVLIQLNDFKGRARRSGGDVLMVRLHGPTLDAGVVGQVVDHLNGTYSAVFPLLWEGTAQPQVTLVHPSEAVPLLLQLNREKWDRVYFRNFFRSGSVTESTICNICLNATTQQVCNFTDLRSGEPWFCYKPENLSCDTRVEHVVGGVSKNPSVRQKLLFQSKVNMKVSIRASGAAFVKVLPKEKGQSELKSRHLVPPPAGYYYRGLWRALDGTTVRHFTTPSNITQCLRGKLVYMYGDSTVRQWFDYLIRAAPDLKMFNLQSPKQSGPHMAMDPANNIMVTFRCHGLPIRIAQVSTLSIKYIANELDSMVGGGNIVVVIGVWAHFGTFPMQVYIRRMQSIRGAVVRLLRRAPSTRVIIRTGNVKRLGIIQAIDNSDWYTSQRNTVLRAIFEGVNVRFVDAWDMTVAHRLPHDLHPPPLIVKNMVDVFLSHICP